MATIAATAMKFSALLSTTEVAELTSHRNVITTHATTQSSQTYHPDGQTHGLPVLDKAAHKPTEVDTIAYKVALGVDTTADRLPEVDTIAYKAPYLSPFATKWSPASEYPAFTAKQIPYVNATDLDTVYSNDSFLQRLLTTAADSPQGNERIIASSSQTLHSNLLHTGASILNDTMGYNAHDSNYMGTDPAWLNITFFSNDTVTQATNVTNSTLDDMPSFVSLNYSLPIMIIISVLLLTLVVITAVGNFLVGLALFKFKNLRTVSNYLIGNLALSDFLLAITILPLSAVNEALGHWIFGRYMCYLWLCIDVLYCTASIWNLCMIAFDRFTATLYPLWYREKRSTKQAGIYIALVWFVAFGICIPPLLGWNDIKTTYFFDDTNHVYQCMLFDNPTYVVYSASGSFYIPFVITTFLYVRIFIVLRQRVRNMRRARKKQQRAIARSTLNEEENKAIAAPNTLTVQTTEIELQVTAMQTDASHQTDDSSKSMRSSESLDHHSEDESCDPKPNHSNGGTNGLLVQHADETTPAENTTPLVIYNSNHNHISNNENNSNKCNTEPDKVKVVVTLEHCNGTSSANNEAVKNIKTTTVKSKRKSQKTDSSKHCNNNISQFKLINIIKSPKPTRRVSQRQRRQDRETKATIRMAIIIAFFCGFWIGFFTTYLLRGIFGNHFYIPRQLDAIFFWLGYSNSAINPILYTIFNEDFRKAFQKILGCYRKGRRPGGYSRTRN